MPFIALLVQGLRWMVAGSIGQWIIKGFLGLGIGIVTTKVALPALMDYVKSRSYGMGSFLFEAFGAIGGDVAFSMILSATVAAVVGNVAIKALAK